MKSISLISFFFYCSCFYSYCQTDPIDPYSKSSCYVSICNNSKKLGNASGFFLEVNSHTYFITNNHVAGGYFHQSEYLRIHKHNAPADSIPNNLKIRIYNDKINSTRFITIPLTKGKDAIYIEFWEDNINKKDPMDIVAIPIDDALKIQLKHTGVLSESNLNPELLLFPSLELFIVGFPYDYGSYNSYPIWKKGSIASEPNLKQIQKHSFLIDATTRAGMSGSPVFFRGGTYNTTNSTNMMAGQITFLIGIYSAQNYDAELGIVWKLDSVLEKLKSIN